jgi:hypothetical protein
MFLHDWFAARSRRPLKPRRRPRLEPLEDRSLLSTFTVIDMGDAGIGFDDHGDLRYCITQANANAEPSNLIEFHRGLTGTIALAQGPLDIAKDLTIRGPADGGITVSGNHRSGVFDITADPRVQAVTITDLTIADGTGVTVNGQRVGGGLYNDHATVTLDHIVVTGNTVANGGGGGIYNEIGTMILNSSTVSGNSVAGTGFGGGIANATGTLTVNASTVSGNSVGGGQFGVGGGIDNGRGGVFVLDSSLIADNHVQATSNSSGDGGGIFVSAGTVTITDSTMSDNTASGEGGGVDFFEPFTSNYHVSVTRSVIRGNRAMNAGGLNSFGATVTIDHTIVSGNAAADVRGASGVDNQHEERMTITDSLISDNTGGSGIANSSQLTLSGSTIAGNSTPAEGGGLRLEDGTAVVVNCTFSGNRAGQSGGAIWMFGDAVGGNGVLELTSVTITQNVAEGVSGALVGGGGLAAPRTPRANTRVIVRNTLIAGNSTASVGPDVLGYVDSVGYNLVGEVEDSRGWASTDRLGHTYAPVDPLLGPLQDNGGPTLTHALLAGSPAIDTGDYRLLVSPDQRGTIRLHNGFNPPVDIGAFDSGVRSAFQIVAPAEVVAGEPFTITVFPIDLFGFKVTAFTGSIHFSSTDDAAVLPDDYTYAPADGGVASFRVTLQTAGSQQLVVNDLESEFFRGTATVAVDAPAAPGRPLAGFADLAFAEANPADWWLPGRKHARTN